MRKSVGSLVGAVLITGCADAFTSQVEVVARAEQYELGVERLAEIIGSVKGMPISRNVAEQVALMWVDYTLYAHSIVSGDSLLDSATVVTAKWADVQQEIASAYHAKLVGDAVRLDSAAVDSAYRAGDHRYIRHILFTVAPDAAPTVRNERQQAAGDVRRRLARGWSWAEASRLTEEPGGAEREGSLGVITRGETVTAFENVAFRLAPGEISDVTETAYGYHVLYRPALAEVFAEYKDALEFRLEDAFDDDYLSRLPERWEIDVRTSAIPAVREVGNDPLRAKRSGTVVGTYRDGGRFRVADVARWIQGLSANIRQQIGTATDSQIVSMVRSLIRNEVLLLEAEAAGVRLEASVIDTLRDALARELSLLSSVIGFRADTLQAVRASPETIRHAAVQANVLAYLDDLTTERRRLQLVPPFLADELRSRFDWDLIPAGVERVVSRAREIRAALNALPAEPRAPVPPMAPVDTAEAAGDP